jgi:hypothetical protein
VLSPYGTAGQGGNVAEWQETDADVAPVVNGPSSDPRNLRGGCWVCGFGNLDATVTSGVTPTLEFNQFGFRVASISSLSGDFNGNGTVDAADYVVWRKTNGPQSNYNLWRSNFGKPPGSSASAELAAAGSANGVPEPATLVMLSTAMLVLSTMCGRAINLSTRDIPQQPTRFETGYNSQQVVRLLARLACTGNSSPRSV